MLTAGTWPSLLRRRPATSLVVLCAALTIAAGCGSTIDSASLPMENDFADCSRFGMNDDVSTVDCPEGELRILVAKPNVSPIHFVPLRFDGRPRALRVAGTARATYTGSVWGLGCLASEPGEAAGAYVLLLGVSLKRLGLPSDAFGSAIVSSVSTFGAERAYGPLNPWYRVPILVLVSEVKEKAVVVEGEIVARPMLTVSATLDHRYLDGSHAGRLVRSARAYLGDPAAAEPEASSDPVEGVA